jgi:broad specificity polyphosphatase/5'/3'-nucleotidase SurE
MKIVPIFEASKYTFDKNLEKFILKISKGELPKFMTINNNILYINKEKSHFIDLNQHPAKICCFLSEVFKSKKEIKDRISTEIPQKTTLSKIKKNTIYCSLIHNFSLHLKEKYNLNYKQFKYIESFIHLCILKEKIKEKDINIINSKIISIPNLKYSNSSNDFYLDIL